jgi:hypothetical protein
MLQKARIPEDKYELERKVGSVVDVMVAEKMAEFSHLDRAPKY